MTRPSASTTAAAAYSPATQPGPRCDPWTRRSHEVPSHSAARSLASCLLTLCLLGCEDDSRPASVDEVDSDVTQSDSSSADTDSEVDDGASNSDAQPEQSDVETDAEQVDSGSTDSTNGVDASMASGPGTPLSADDVVPVVIAPVEASTPLCSTSDWSAPVALEQAPERSFDRLLSVSADGKSWLVEVFVAEDAARRAAPPAEAVDAGSSGAADAAVATDSGVVPRPGNDVFVVDLPNTITPVELSADYDLSRGGALSPDGSTLVVVHAVPNILGLSKREGRGVAFGAPDPNAFVRLQNLALQTGYAYEMPTFSASGTDLYVSVRFRSEHQIHRLASDGTHWTTASVLSDVQSTLPNPTETTLTSIAPDDRTLFFWDEADRSVVVVELSPQREPTGRATQLEVPAPVFVNGDCTELWTLDSDGRLAVVSAD